MWVFLTVCKLILYKCISGVLMWEIFTGGIMPYDKMKNVEVVDYVCHSRQRLEKPASCPEKIYKVMLQCWQHVCI